MRLFRRRRATPAFTADLAPAVPIAVIGDIHGCHTLLERLLARIGPDILPITVGDYIDRGDRSREVLETLHALETRGRILCLAGNHEDMLTRFLQAPEETGNRWLRVGGLQTLASFGIGQVTQSSGPDALRDARDALLEALGPLSGWVAALPLSHRTGNVTVVHAGADPALPLDSQSRETLLWGHPAFARHDRQDGQWVVFGHTIVPEVTATRGRIGVDTGAYATGCLSAALLRPDGGFEVIDERLTPGGKNNP